MRNEEFRIQFLIRHSPFLIQNGHCDGRVGTSNRRVAPAGISSTVIVRASIAPSLRRTCTWSWPGSTIPIPTNRPSAIVVLVNPEAGVADTLLAEDITTATTAATTDPNICIRRISSSLAEAPVRGRTRKIGLGGGCFKP